MYIYKEKCKYKYGGIHGADPANPLPEGLAVGAVLGIAPSLLALPLLNVLLERSRKFGVSCWDPHGNYRTEAS